MGLSLMWSVSDFLKNCETSDGTHFYLPILAAGDLSYGLEFLSFGFVGRDEWDSRAMDNAHFVHDFMSVLTDDYWRFRNCWREKTRFPDAWWDADGSVSVTFDDVDEAAAALDDVWQAFNHSTPIDSIFLYLMKGMGEYDGNIR